MAVRRPLNLWCLALLLAVPIMLVVGWVRDRPMTQVEYLSRIGMVATCALLAIFAICRQWSKHTRQCKSLRRYLDALCRLEPNDLNGAALDESLPTIDSDNPWYEVGTRVRNCIRTHGERVQESDCARARAEVRAHRAISELEQLSLILSGLTDPVVVIDNYDEIVLSNPCAERVLDFNLVSAESRAIQRVLHCETLIQMLMETRRRKTPAQRTGEVTLCDPMGTSRTFRITCRSLASPSETRRDDDEPRGAVAVLNDITNEKTIQKRNAEFVAAVSHEMKTPLSGIKAYAELLADGEADDEATREEFVGVISGQAERLQRLVENLLSLARIEAGVVQVNKHPRSLNEMLAATIEVMQPAAHDKNIALHCELSPLYLGVLADADMLMQAAMNLLSNAIKYTAPGGKVILRSRLDDCHVVFEVEDSGVGLSPEDCERVFDRFYRVQKDATMAPGTGLGLPLAKHIVEDVHSGRLTLSSELGKGSVFRVTLPSARLTN